MLLDTNGDLVNKDFKIRTLEFTLANENNH